jgi:hypothetical protein
MSRDGFLAAVAEATAAQDAVLGSESEQAQITPKMVEVVQLLVANPLLVTPTLKWLKQKEAELAGAQLAVLYSSEELTAMREKAAKTPGQP